jgi:hypothetical protein
VELDKILSADPNKTADFSTMAANAPPSVEMTRVWFCGERTDNDELQKQLQLQTADPSTPPSTRFTRSGSGRDDAILINPNLDYSNL